MTKDYPLNPNIPNFPAAAKISIGASSDADVLEAIAANKALPNREVSLGHIAADFSGKSDVPVQTGLGPVSFKAAVNARLGVGIYDKSASVLAALNFADAGDLKIDWKETSGSRFAILVAGYSVDASASGTHPIGVIGSATFGVDASQASNFAVITRFPPAKGADDVLRDLLNQWRLPAMIDHPTDLNPGTSILVEANGTIAFKLGAKLGYDVSYVKAIEAGGLTGDLGLKVAAALSAEFGLSASGRYIVSVERADETAMLRVRLFKLAVRGWTFALNLTVGANAITPNSPATVDDLVPVIFGVHGKQVIADLQQLEKWTDPNKNVGDLVAGLVNQKAQDLIKTTTGIDPIADFNAARTKFVNAIKAWQNLPGKTSAWLWSELQSATGASTTAELKAALPDLTTGSDDDVMKFIAGQIQSSGFNGALGQLLDSVADDSVLALLDRIPQVRQTAGAIQSLLDGDLLKKLQDALASEFKLDPIIEGKWASVDLNGWLVTRLGKFFGETLGLSQLNQVKDAINAVIGKRNTIYDAVVAAAKRTYEAKFSYAYDSATTRTALLDATFDLAVPSAAAVYRDMIQAGNWDPLFQAPITGVVVGTGVLTHGITRNSSLQLTLPMLKLKVTDAVSSLAQLSVESDGTDLVGTYSLSASDEARSVDRYRSRLTLTAAMPTAMFQGGGLRVHGEPTSNWSYSYRFVQTNSSFREVAALVAPIQQSYFADKFQTADGSFDHWLLYFDQAIGQKLNNGANNFGNLLFAFEFSISSSFLSAWFVPRTKASQLQAACLASQAVQRTLRSLLLNSYAADLTHLNAQESTYALLLYAALPIANYVEYDDGDDLPTLSTDKPYWDYENWNYVQALAYLCPETAARLGGEMKTIRDRWVAANNSNLADKFSTSNVDTIIREAIGGINGIDYHHSYLHGLLNAEAKLISAVTQAIADMSVFVAQATSAPANAISALADFGAKITSTFNSELDPIYVPSSSRAIGSTLFCEVTRSMNATFVAQTRTFLALTVLNSNSTFKIPTFLEGKMPEQPSIALEQRLLTGE